MNPEQINIQKYIESIPQKIQDVVFSSEWENRTNEISKKYSLDAAQAETLSNTVLLVLIGIVSPDKFTSIIIEDLNISSLLAEQIVDDLENRVFEYALKMIEEKPTKQGSSTQNQARVPEIKPDNLPATEIGEVAKPYTPEYKAPVSTPRLTEEPVQRPYSVPRFGMAQVEPKVQVINMTQNKPQNPESVMASKMESVTVNMGSNFIQKSSSEGAEMPKMPTTKYSADPYREPIN
jgi:hypothetical protein